MFEHRDLYMCVFTNMHRYFLFALLITSGVGGDATFANWSAAVPVAVAVVASIADVVFELRTTAGRT